MQGQDHLCDMKCFAENKVHVCNSEEHLYYKKDRIQGENIWKSNIFQMDSMFLRKVTRAAKIKENV
jgi:hypothetical protein